MHFKLKNTYFILETELTKDDILKLYIIKIIKKSI